MKPLHVASEFSGSEFRRFRWAALIVTVGLVAWAVADGAGGTELDRKQQHYFAEQARIELEIARIRLSAARGEITALVAQDQVDAWTQANEARLIAQAELATELDRLSPVLVESAGTPPADPVMDGAPEAARFAELSAMEELAMEDLRARAQGVELQGLIDDWAHSPQGAAILEEKASLWNQASARRALTVQSVVLAVSPDAPAAEVATLDYQERIVRRIHEIRSANPGASPLEIQDLIDDRKEEFDEDIEAVTALMRQAALARAEADVARLEQEAKNLSPPEGSTETVRGTPTEAGQ